MIVFDAGVFTDCGAFRDKNEDSFSLCGKTLPEEMRKGRYGSSAAKQSYGVAAVFDGMGGERYGDLASACAAEMLNDYSADILNRGPGGVHRFVSAANGRICKMTMERSAPMGSTMVLVAISDGDAAVFNIGDSRGYILRDGQIRQVTKDHTVAAGLDAIGVKGSGKSAGHQLTQYLGIPPEELVVTAFTLGKFKLRAGDRILLCSDGVTDGLNENHIAGILSQGKTANELALEIAGTAIAQGSRDNITAMVISFFDDGAPEGLGAESLRNPAFHPRQGEKGQEGAKAEQRAKSQAYKPKHLASKSPPSKPQKKEGTGIYWAINILLGLLLGFVLGLIFYFLIKSI